MKLLHKRWLIKGLVSHQGGVVSAYLGEDGWFADSTLAKLHNATETEELRNRCHRFHGSLCATGIGGAMYVQHIQFIEVTLGAT